MSIIDITHIGHKDFIVHQNCAGLVYGRFLGVCKDDRSKFRMILIRPDRTTMLKYDNKHVAWGWCIPSAVGLPIESWGRVSDIVHHIPSAADDARGRVKAIYAEFGWGSSQV